MGSQDARAAVADFWLLDLTTNKTHRLTNLSDRGYLNHLDVNA
ncbi:MAG: hypothetical protein ABIS29_17805 [Vicinamibacterales bacterium]